MCSIISHHVGVTGSPSLNAKHVDQHESFSQAAAVQGYLGDRSWFYRPVPYVQWSKPCIHDLSPLLLCDSSAHEGWTDRGCWFCYSHENLNQPCPVNDVRAELIRDRVHMVEKTSAWPEQCFIVPHMEGEEGREGGGGERGKGGKYNICGGENFCFVELWRSISAWH